ncbi:peptidase M20, partial [Microbacterium sp. SUBG005]
MARIVLALHALADLDAGTSVNVGTVAGGSRSNVTAGRAEALVDVRVTDVAESERIDAALTALEPHRAEATLDIAGG